MLSSEMLYAGRHSAPPAPIPLRAGPLTALFEPATSFLRSIRIGDHEIIRAIYGAVRDERWNNIPPQLSDLNVTQDSDSFAITFSVRCQAPGIDFLWRCAITGTPKGQIQFTFDGEAAAAFAKTRIGLCVLHPILECAGKPCQIEHPDGSIDEGLFPKLIAPLPPFTNIRAITHEPAPGVRAEIRFAGEIFEMEDQRNWTDASYKTYCTPLSVPFPVLIERGAKITQSVQLSLLGTPRKILPILLGRPPQVSIATTPVLARPPLGLMFPPLPQPLPPLEIGRLRQLSLGHLRLNLRLADPSYPSQLESAVSETNQINIPLHLALFFTDNAEAEFRSLLSVLPRLRPQVALWLLFHEKENVTSPKWIRLARQILAEFAPNLLVAAGAHGSFAEFNSERPDPASPALPCFAITPQCHASDNQTLIENLGAQAHTLETAQSFCPKTAVVSPVTLRPWISPREASSSAAPADGPEDASADSRQASLFAAGWTLGSIATLSTHGHLHSLTYFETIGTRGIMRRRRESVPPSTGPGIEHPAEVFPLYHLLADLAGYDRILPTQSSHPLQIAALTLLNSQNAKRILVANLTSDPQTLRIKTGAVRAAIRFLDERNAAQALQDPDTFRALPGQLQEAAAGKIEVPLLPFAYARLDLL